MITQLLHTRMRYVILFAFLAFALPVYAQQWQPIGLQDKDTRGFYTSPHSGAMFAGTNDGIYRSTNSGGTWERVLTTQLLFASWRFAATSQDTIFASGSFDRLARSFDGGVTWEEFDSELVLQELGVIKGMFADDHGYVYLGTTGAVLRSKDGDNWQTINNGLPASSPDVHTFAKTSTDEVLAGTQGIVGGHIYRLSGSSTTWTKIYDGILNQDIIALETTSSSTILASVFNKGLIRSTNGTSWEVISISGISSPITTILANNIAVYAIAGTTILRSMDDGATWETVITAPATVNAATLGLNGSLLVATPSGLYRLVVTTDVEERPNPEIQLAVFPQPVRDNAHCSFTLPTTSAVRGTLTNTAGKIVRELPAITYPAGTHTFSWNTTGLAAGVYFINLEAGGTFSSHRIVVVP